MKARDGHLWKLEGSKEGPPDSRFLEESEDAFQQIATGVEH